MSHDDGVKPPAWAAYETLAAPFAASVDTKPHNAYYERPATLSLISASFDVILSTPALDYVKAWDRVFREFYRILCHPGSLISSVSHPFADFQRHPMGNYFQTEFIEDEFRGFGTPIRVPSYRRPLGALLNPLLEAGFTSERIVEPTPTEAFQQRDPKDCAELLRQPVRHALSGTSVDAFFAAISLCRGVGAVILAIIWTGVRHAPDRVRSASFPHHHTLSAPGCF